MFFQVLQLRRDLPDGAAAAGAIVVRTAFRSRAVKITAGVHAWTIGRAVPVSGSAGKIVKIGVRPTASAQAQLEHIAQRVSSFRAGTAIEIAAGIDGQDAHRAEVGIRDSGEAVQNVVRPSAVGRRQLEDRASAMDTAHQWYRRRYCRRDP